jgi:CheY-like chemotaxis protein
VERRSTVLVVDDDVANIMLLAQLLQDDYEIVFTTGG